MSSELVTLPRLLNLDIPRGQSAFLWGTRTTGKSTYLDYTFPNSIKYDLLQSDLYLTLLKKADARWYQAVCQAVSRFAFWSSI